MSCLGLTHCTCVNLRARGRRGTSCSMLGICVAGTALGALWLQFAWQARHFKLSKGGDVRSGVVRCRAWGSGALCLEFAWQARHFVFYAWNLRGRHGTWSFVVAICVAGAALAAVQGTMLYALASSGVVPGAPGSVLGIRGSTGALWLQFACAALAAALRVLCLEFAWQARHLELCGCNLRGRRGTWGCPRDVMYALASSGVVPGAPGLCAWNLRGRRGTSCSMLAICVAGTALGALCLQFAWQARHFKLSKGGDVRSGVVRCRAWGSGALCLEFAWQARHFVFYAWNLRGRHGTWSFVVAICVAGAALAAVQGRCCTLWRRPVSCLGLRGLCLEFVAGAALRVLCLQFAWQAQHLELCGCNLRGRRGTWGCPREVMYALASSGVVPGAPGLCAWNLRGRRGTSCSMLGICVAGTALGALWLQFAWQARHFKLSKGGDVRSGVVRCRAWGSGALCLEFAWQARHFVFYACNLRGRHGTWSFVVAICVAGAALAAVQGRCCTLWRRPVSCLGLRGLCLEFVAGAALRVLCLEFAWQAQHLELYGSFTLTRLLIFLSHTDSYTHTHTLELSHALTRNIHTCISACHSSYS